MLTVTFEETPRAQAGVPVPREHPRSTARNGCSTRDVYQGMRWIRPRRIRMAAARAIRTAHASSEKRGADLVGACGLLLVILILLLRRFCCVSGWWKNGPPQKAGPTKKPQERGGRARPLQGQEQPKSTARNGCATGRRRQAAPTSVWRCGHWGDSLPARC